MIDDEEDRKKTLFQYKIVDNDSDVDMFEGLGNTTIKEAISNSDDEGSDKAGNDGAPFRKNSRSPPRVKKNTQVCQSQAFALMSKGPTNMANKD